MNENGEPKYSPQSSIRKVHCISYLLKEGFQEISDANIGIPEDYIFISLRKIKKRFNIVSSSPDSLIILFEGLKYKIQYVKGGDYYFFIISQMEQYRDGVEGCGLNRNDSKLYTKIKKILPGSPTFEINLYDLGSVHNMDEGISLFQDISKNNSLQISVGGIYGSDFLARINEDLDSPKREMLYLRIISTKKAENNLEHRTDQIYNDLGHLCSHIGRIELLSSMYPSYKDIFEIIMEVADEHCGNISKKLEDAFDKKSEFGIGISKEELSMLESNMADIMLDINNIHSMNNKLSSIILSFEKSRLSIEKIFALWVEIPVEGFGTITPFEIKSISLKSRDYEIGNEKLIGEKERIQQILVTIKTSLDISLTKITERNTQMITLLSLIFACFGVAGFLGEFMGYNEGGKYSPVSWQGLLLFFSITLIPTSLIGIATYIFIKRRLR